jgi:hypothetical protein
MMFRHGQQKWSHGKQIGTHNVLFLIRKRNGIRTSLARLANTTLGHRHPRQSSNNASGVTQPRDVFRFSTPGDQASTFFFPLQPVFRRS